MKWTTATALLLALSAAGVGAAVVATREPMPPAEMLASVRSRMGRPLFDSAEALRELDAALEGRGGRLTLQLERDLLRTRADLYADIGSLDRAREDVERLIASHEAEALPDRDPLVQRLALEAVQLQSEDGDLLPAFQRIEQLTTERPENAEAWLLKGDLAEKIARQGLTAEEPGLDQLLERAGTDLTATQFSRVRELIESLVSRDARDPDIEELEVQLAGVFEITQEAELRWLLENVDAPRAWFSEARAAYSQSLGAALTPHAVVRLADSLVRAGQLDLAIKLQTIARHAPSVAHDPESAMSFLHALATGQRVAEVNALVRGWDWELDTPAEFYRFAGEFLFESGDLQALPYVAEGLSEVGEDTAVYWARGFFSPVAGVSMYEVQTSRLASAVQQLEQERDPAVRAELVASRDALRGWLDHFRGTKTTDLVEFSRDTLDPEPFAGARRRAAIYAAEAYRVASRANPARSQFSSALTDNPDDSAEAWAHYGELLEDAGLVRGAEEAFSRAMSLDPSLSATLESRWYAAGEQDVEDGGSTLASLIDQAARQGTALPSGAFGASIQTRIAQDHLAGGRHAFAIQAARKALENYPGLVAPLDVIIGAKLSKPGRYSVLTDILQRIEMAGVDERVERFLDQIDGESLEGEDLLRAIHASPERFGRAAAARWHMANGEAEAALRIIDGDAAPAGLRLLSARLLVESGSYEQALSALDDLDGPARTGSEADLLRLRALLGLGRLEATQAHVGRIVDDHPLPGGREVFLGAIDELLNAGALRPAFSLVEQLDSTAETRTPGFYRRRVLLDLVLSDARGVSAAKESILRAEPYLTDGTPEIAAILLAVFERDWATLPRLVDSIERSSFEPDAYQATALQLLGEQLEDGARSAAAGLAANPRDPFWALLDAAATTLVSGDVTLGEWFGGPAAEDLSAFLSGRDARESQDPRDAIALFLASRQPGFLPWTSPRLAAHAAATGSSIWCPLLQIEVASSSKDESEISRILAELVRSHPRFGPGHDLTVQRAEAAHPTEPLHPEVVQARTRRLDAMTPRLIADDVEVLMATAGKLAGQSRYAEAVRALLPLSRSDGPDATTGRIMLSVLQLQAGAPAFAAQYLHAAAMKDLGVYEHDALESLVESIRLALVDGGGRGGPRGNLEAEDGRRMLRDLRARYPHDPLIALAELELLEVEDGERGRRARGMLDELQRAAGEQALDSLRPGSTRSWARFLAPIAPEVASDLVRKEHLKEPGNLDLLQLTGELARIGGDLQTARREYETLLAIEPRAEVAYALSEVLLQGGATRSEVDPLLVQTNGRAGASSARSSFLQSLAELNVPRPSPLTPGQLERFGEGRVNDHERRQANERRLVDGIVERLEGLWRERAGRAEALDAFEVGLAYATALSRRGTAEDDAAVLALVSELRPLAMDRYYVPALLETLESVARAAAEARSGS